MLNLRHALLPNVKNTDIEKKVVKFAVHIVEIVAHTNRKRIKIAYGRYEVYPMDGDLTPRHKIWNTKGNEHECPHAYGEGYPYV